jgi:LmbE family N-acetylglucosaminyl deacetylase
MIANIKKTLKIKRSNYLVFLFLFLFLLEIPGLVYISSLPRYPEINYSINIIPVFSKNDNVLILAPHPDDEAIANAGIIQEALKAGSAVKVVVFTNGDFNSTSLPFIEKTKNPAGAPQEFLKLGEVRRSESISAMQTLGLKKDNLIFLGYPDFGTLEIFLKYWDTENPYQSLATKETKVPYPDSYSYGADYKGESVLKDLESIISGYKPTKIFIPNSFDSHKDHRAMYLFAQVALWDLKDIIQGYQVFTYLTHVKNWPVISKR